MGGLSAASLAVAPAVAEVRYPSGTLSWEAPPECPDEPALILQVEEVLGQPLTLARAQQLAISAEVSGSQIAGYVVVVTVRTENGQHQRRLQHADCAKLSEGAALVMALAIDPGRVMGRPEPSTAASTGKPPEPSAAPAQEPHAEPAEPNMSTSRGWVDVEIAALTGVGDLPGVGFGAEGGTDLLLTSRFRVGAGAEYWAPRSELVDETTGGRIRLGLWDVGPRVCWVPLVGDIELSGCGGPVWGAMRGQGVSVDAPRVQRDVWAALMLKLALGARLTKTLWLRGGIGAGLAFERARFALEAPDATSTAEIRSDSRSPDNTSFQPRPWVLRGILGVTWRWP